MCKDFLAMSDDNKDAAVAEMLKERDKRNASTGDVEATRMILVGSLSARRQTRLQDQRHRLTG